MEAASAAASASNTTGSPGHGWLRTTNLALATVGIAVCTPLLVMRIYTKIRIMKKFWWDDGEYAFRRGRVEADCRCRSVLNMRLGMMSLFLRRGNRECSHATGHFDGDTRNYHLCVAP